ncbi:MAG TPA: hypothetical protein VMW10_00910 [Alphaproteobacteria bacterium]|nr:hypothetical protein [Alphaproteobacteria bacterium]
MVFRTRLKKGHFPVVFSFLTGLIISDATLQLCLADEPAETRVNSGSWTTIGPGSWTTLEPIPEPAPPPAPQPPPSPSPKPTAEPEQPQPEGPPPTPDQLGSCFGGCIPTDQNCKMQCLQKWQKAGGR